MLNNARINELISQWDPALQKAFLDSIYKARSGADVNHITRMLEQGNVEDALRAAGLDPTAFRPFDLTLAQAYEAGGEATARIVPAILSSDGLRTIFQFNIRNPVAEDWLANHSSTAIVQILADQRVMVRNALQNGLSQGLNPRSVALDIVGRINPASGRREGGLIGLTDSQAQWVRNYETELRSDDPSQALTRALRDKRFDVSVKQAADSGEPLTDQQVSSMVRTYTNRALRMRAEAIGRTEAMAALHGAQEQAINQAVEGGIEPNDVRYTWRTAHDNRVRDSHVTMDGETVGINEKFITGNGAELAYPGDPSGPPEEIINCRCWREVRIDFLSNIE